MGPSEFLVSVLVPTRNRVKLLEKSLRSLKDNARLDFKQKIEIIIKLDEDDVATQNWVIQNNAELWTTLLPGPRGRGYADLHVYYNDMCRLARGEFLFLWNDDAEMLTPGWDLEINRQLDGKPCYLQSEVSDIRGRDAFLFPIVHRSWYDSCGHFSMSPHNDTYVFNAFIKYPQLFRKTAIVVRHAALQNLHDITSLEARGWWPTTKRGWGSPEVQDSLASDIKRLGELVKQYKL